jgi:hypothetical protein
MVFVYGTLGSREENEWSFNKARYDAETWYYRGNGAVDVISDKEYMPERYQGRNVILYGNASTNAAWGLLLKDCPIQVRRGELKVGGKVFTGDDLAAYFIRPLADGRTSVGAITGTGMKGLQAANANQYFAGGSGFPDYMIFRLQMLQAGAAGILMAGFFDNSWKLSEDWGAAWLTDSKEPVREDSLLYQDNPAPLFRKEFSVSAGLIRRSTLYITGVGYYQATINGQKLANQFLDPGWTDYRKTVPYNTFEVTRFLKAGRNCLGVELGIGCTGDGKFPVQ